MIILSDSNPIFLVKNRAVQEIFNLLEMPCNEADGCNFCVCAGGGGRGRGCLKIISSGSLFL